MNLLAPRTACKFALLLALSGPLSVAAQAPARFHSTEIHPDRSVDFLKTKEMPVTQIETPGLHTWLVWRDNLIHFTPLLFQQK